MKKLIGITILIFLFSCEKMNWDNATTYTIKKGDHNSIVNISPLYGGGLKTSVRFDESAIYDLGNENQGDWNKLIGFTEEMVGVVPGNPEPKIVEGVHDNSARISWRWNIERQQIELGYYAYIDGEVKKGHLYWLEIDEPVSLMIRDDQEKQNYVIDIYGNYKVVHHGQKFDEKKFWCYPYFGGNETAPHDITIKFGRYEL